MSPSSTCPGCLHPGGQYEINGVKYSDLNNNGVRDPGEPGLVGWTINLERPQGTIIDTHDNRPRTVPITLSAYSLLPISSARFCRTVGSRQAPQGGYAEVTLSGEVPIQTVDFGNRQKIVPALECVRENPDGSYTAKFTYDNPNGEITIPKGDNNKIEPDPISGSQPDTFFQRHKFVHGSLRSQLAHHLDAGGSVSRGHEGLSPLQHRADAIGC